MTEESALALQSLRNLQQRHKLNLLRLAESLPSSDAQRSSVADIQCMSDSSLDAIKDAPTPSSLNVDLAQYRNLFTNLQLSYTEQVKKEKVLRSLISSSPPAPGDISSAENAELEAEFAEIKDTLEQQKVAVNDQLIHIEAHARELARRHQLIETQAQQLRDIPRELERLQKEITQRRQEQAIGAQVGNGRAEEGLALEATLTLVEEREGQLERVQVRLNEMNEQRTRKEKELKKVRDEAAAAERERDKAVKSAEDSERGRYGGKSGIGDEVERKGRWLKGVETTMTGLLGVEG